jgi:hypothetical protein
MHPNCSKDVLTSGSSLIKVNFWGLGPTFLLLHTPFLMFWEVAMVQHVFVLRAMDLARALGKSLDKPKLARRTTNSA